MCVLSLGLDKSSDSVDVLALAILESSHFFALSNGEGDIKEHRESVDQNVHRPVSSSEKTHIDHLCDGRNALDRILFAESVLWRLPPAPCQDNKHSFYQFWLPSNACWTQMYSLWLLANEHHMTVHVAPAEHLLDSRLRIDAIGTPWRVA